MTLRGGGVVGRVREALDEITGPTVGESDPVAGAVRETETLPVVEGRPLVVAFSGGLDSCVLLHLLRFAMDRDLSLIAAHFDHGMRPGSAADREWAGGVCRAWGVPFEHERARATPVSEAEARSARYAFLHEVRERTGAAWLLTAHHADDQAETVLFRVLRGTGIEGLRGMRRTRAPGVARPLLGCWREELEAYARARGVRWREDPTNEHLGYARNALRHDILPAAESRVAPGARRALVRLAVLAEADEAAWAEVLPAVLERLDFTPEAEPVRRASLDRDATVALGPPLRARVLRRVASLCGWTLDEAATGRAVAFAEEGSSGRRVELGGGLELRRELDRLVLDACPDVPREKPPDEPVRIVEAGAGTAKLRLAGQELEVRWRVVESSAHPGSYGDEGDRVSSFGLDGLIFPLTLRARGPGDRIETTGGTRTLKKVMLEARIGRRERLRRPVLVDGQGRVLWIPGVARSTTVPVGDRGALEIRIGS